MSERDTSHPAAPAAIVEEDGRTVLMLHGELDLATVGALQGFADALIRQAPECLVIDLAGVCFMDSSGIALLLGLATRLPRTAIRNPSPMIRQVVEMTGLTETLPIVT